MSQQSYLARHRQGRLYGPVEQPIVLRSGFDVKDFTYRAQGSLRPELDLAAFDRAPLDPAVLEDLRYLRDMERSTMGQVRSVVVSYTNKESRVAAFLTTWAYERHWIADAYQAVLDAHGPHAGAPQPPEHSWVERVETALDNISPMVDSVWTNFSGEAVVAGQTARGWSQEASTRAALRMLERRAGHPELSSLLRRVAEVKATHERFFAEETTARVRTDPRAQRFARAYLTFAFHPLRPVGLSHAHARRFLRDLAPTVAQRRELFALADEPMQATPGTAGSEPLRRAVEREWRLSRYAPHQTLPPASRSAREATAPTAHPFPSTGGSR